MKRKIYSTFLALLLILALAIPVSATAPFPRIVDSADLLTAEEIQLLEEASYEFCVQYSLDAAILTVDSLGGVTIDVFADDYYDANGYGVGTDYSGLLLVVAMEERELYISTCGDAINRLSDRELDEIISNISYELSEENYYDAFQLFFGFTTLSLDYESTAVVEVDTGINWLLSILTGAVVAGITVLIMRGSMNTKRKQHSAGDYVRAGSYDLKNRQDIYLYSNVSKVRREQNKSGGGTSVHRSSSGRSHGGRGGKF